MKAGWKESKLKDCILPFVLGTKVPKKAYNTSGNFPIISQEEEFISGYWSKAEDLTKVDTCVVVYGDHTQVVKLVDFDFVAGADGIKVLSPKPEISPSFLFYFIMGNKVASLGYARHFRHLKEMIVPIPPLEEQRRIVAILDEAFEGLETAQANAKANLASAEELLASYLDILFYNVSESGGVESISDLCDSIIDCLNRTAPTVDQITDYKMIRTTNIRNGELNMDGCKFVTKETFETWTRRQVPKYNDVLLTREAPVGETALIKTSDNVFLGQRIVSYRVNEGKMTPQYLMYALRSKFLKNQFNSLESGATVQHIRVPQSKSLKIPITDLGNQKAICQTLSSLENEIKKALVNQTKGMHDIQNLRQSLLQKAFAGELT